MGISHVTVSVGKTPASRKKRRVRCLVDTGAVLTVLPAALLRELGIRPHDEEEFGLADGTVITRLVGRAFIEYRGRGEYTRVVFGQPGDSNLLGVLTLEELQFFVDPFHRKLRHLPLRL